MLSVLLGIALVGQEPAAKPPQAVPPERPYIWSPKAGPEPHLTGPAIFGVRPLSPISFIVTATGKRPMTFTAENLPPGLTLNAGTGVLSGSVGFPGNFRTRLTAKNSAGSDTRDFRVVVGETLCLTPPMSVVVPSPESIPAIQAKLLNSGWTQVQLNEPLKSLDAIAPFRAANLRVGVIKSKVTPEEAKSLAEAGVDALMYGGLDGQSEAASLAEAFRASGRDVSLQVQGVTSFEAATSLKGKVQSWRTARSDRSWLNILAAGFSLDPWSPLASPGSWNDPGPLFIGAEELSPSEQYSQMTLWCLLSAPLMLATDPAALDEFDLSLLTNREVLEVNQDPLGKQARLTYAAGDFEVWSKLMEDQTLAIGVFNKGETEAKATLDFGDPSVKSVAVRDLWKQEKMHIRSNILPLVIRRHGAMLFRTNKNVDFRFRLGHDPKKPKKKGGGR